MKISLKLILFLVVSCESFVSFKPRQAITQKALQSFNNDMCRGRMDGFLFPDDENCHMFIECQAQNSIRRTCPPSTLFNMELFYCFPENSVNCGSRQKPRGGNNLVGGNQILTALEMHHSICRNQSGVLFENPSNCRAFIECRDNFRLDRECESGKLFEASSKTCMIDFVVNCKDRAIVLENEFLDNICSGIRNGNLIPHPSECDSYFSCTNNNSIMKKCPPQSLFETSSNMCISEFLVNCGRRRRSSANFDQPLPIFSTICETLATGTRISNPENCQSYFECRNGQRVEISCPTSTSFDAIASQCRENSLVNCVQRNGQQNEVCTGQRDGQRYFNPLDCSEYFECQNGMRVEKKCPNSQLYSHQLLSCAPASTVNCGSRRQPQSPNRQQDGIQMPCRENGVYITAHPLPCQSTYFICMNGTTIQHSCANGIIFNSQTLQCDFAENSNCVSRSPQIPRAMDCNNQSFFPHLTSCNQYYICVNGSVQLMRCPSGKIWDNNRARCEQLNQYSQCNGRIDG